MPDRNYYENEPDHPWAPARKCFAVTPHDTDALAILPTRGLRAGGAGTVTLRAIDSEADVAHPVADGEYLPIVAEYVRATGTDVDVIGYA